MPIDPRAPWPTDPTAQLYARIADLTRRLEANPGAQSGGGAINDPYAVPTGPDPYTDAGPAVALTVPAGGAFVQLYAEVEGHMVASGTGGALEVWIAERVNDPPNFNLTRISPIMRWANAWTGLTTVALPAVDNGSNVNPNGNATSPPEDGLASRSMAGSLMQKWTLGGLHTYTLATRIQSASGGAAAELRSRRLMARILQ